MFFNGIIYWVSIVYIVYTFVIGGELKEVLKARLATTETETILHIGAFAATLLPMLIGQLTIMITHRFNFIVFSSL